MANDLHRMMIFWSKINEEKAVKAKKVMAWMREKKM
jgi:hypothetical protein